MREAGPGAVGFLVLDSSLERAHEGNTVDPHTQALLVVAGIGVASGLLLIGVVALRLRVDGRSFRASSSSFDCFN